MAIYYLAAQVIGRSAGRSVVAAAAYRSGERLVDERTGQVHDDTRRQEDIEDEIPAPLQAPAWATNREQLWNRVEAVERRSDSQLAREVVIALPVELDRERQRGLVKDYVQEQFVARGMVADVAMHFKAANPHSHILLTMREIGPEGFGKKAHEWNRPELLEEWREQWARHANGALERAGRPERIDHRSLEAQGKDLLPQVQVGPSAAALERQGVEAERGDRNRLVAEHNAAVIDLEKVRQEREALRQEQERAERYAGRLEAGWHEQSARAMEVLEARHGSILNQDDLTRLEERTYKDLSRVTDEISPIDAEQRRLALVGDILKHRERLAAQVERLETPWGAVRRLFSHSARTEYEGVRQRLELVERGLGQSGVRDAADLERQRNRWQATEAPRKPALARESADLTGTYNLVRSALDGFSRQWMRQLERDRERERARQVALLGRDRSGEAERDEERPLHRERTRGYDRGVIVSQAGRLDCRKNASDGSIHAGFQA